MSDQPTPKRRRFPWGRVVLLVSLALNFLVIGVVVGVLAGILPDRGPRGGARHLDRVSMGLGPYIQALPAGAQETVKAAGGGFDRDARRARISALRNQRRTVVRLLRASPFDPEALRAALADQRSRAFATTPAVQEAFVVAFTALTSEERAAVLERAQEFRKARGKSKGNRGP
ncbi:MAG: periplasmic heavy metal sensor [Pseudomonadota bacterium]